MLICTFFCLLGRVALEDNLLDWRRSSLFLCLVLSRWGKDRALVEPDWETPALAVEADFFTCSLKVKKWIGIVKREIRERLGLGKAVNQLVCQILAWYSIFNSLYLLQCTQHIHDQCIKHDSSL